ncbi:MAG: ScyD/ScyE family protein [Gemmatimonadota bacterium]
MAGCESGTAPLDNTPPAQATVGRVTANATVSVFATGLKFPRGLAFGPGGDLFVAEAGSGGTMATTPVQCDQVVPPAGPYANGPTGRISRINKQGVRTTVADGFPSGINGFGDVLGVADVAFIGSNLYALVAGGGCSHGSADVPAEVALVRPGQSTWSKLADLSKYQAANPVQAPAAGDFEPDGSWYGMIQQNETLVAVEANHGEVVRITRQGNVSRIADISALYGHIVPTVVAQWGGNLYISELGTFPLVNGSQTILKIDPQGNVTQAATGFTTVLGLDFDARGRMYVLETTAGPFFPSPGTGRVIRVDLQGNRDVLADKLMFPTGLRFGPDGAVYVSNVGFGPPATGEILRIVIPGTTEK